MKNAQITGHGRICTSVPAGMHKNVYNCIVCYSKGLETSKRMASNCTHQPGWLSGMVFNGEKIRIPPTMSCNFYKAQNEQN